MMSVRSFSRHFKAADGISFTAWLINTRLNNSVELLESTNLSILEIAEKAGFSSEQIFRKHFKQRYDTNPMAWRKLFNGAGE
ncbi:MAG: helix-turn-helix domain-containing protein [Thalassotalea sp.]|nr:helix-turn-helix domain-containing protein [Thalassotalea sp.]